MNKVITWVLSPFGILFLGLLIALLLHMCCPSKRWARRLAVIIICFSLAFVWIMGCPATTRVLGPALENPYAREGVMHGDISDLPTADAIVVLGGGLFAHAKCGASDLSSAADRAWQGARLYHAKKAPIIVLSGSEVEVSTVPFLMDLGVPREAIICNKTARNTAEEAHQLLTLGYRRILLVTSAWHMSRAEYLFARVGFDVIPAATDFEFNYIAESNLKYSHFFPLPDAFERNSRALKEWIALLGYRVTRKNKIK